MLKDLTLIVDARTKEAGSYALSLAKLIDAHLTLFLVDVETALATYSMAELRYDLILAEREERREAIVTTVTRLQSQGKAQGLSVDALHLEESNEAEIGRLNRTLRLFDLIIIEQAYGEQIGERARMIEAAIFEAARPVLLVPNIQTTPPSLKTILVAWDGSAPAARALDDALPLLVRANHVEIVEVVTKSSVPCDEATLMRHLARHGVDAVFRQTPSTGDIGNTLLSHAADVGADLLVMGAYGHSRLREAFLGGATRTILECMTIPVLMSR
ncbi:universal stress protein [Methylovirgula sp. 4M-Z18]|uniref:universal stress protein n=1 Tax=Methylovirgula sp. 4M-Z18 TaxID=2293567 RepID=UPI000E2E57BE|nr:universal stress protein [Methylovirgula sp. 4M-Z18]RFB76471.1 universal stress protein [Methylovirgula sp. 4M-Z18]